MSERVATNTNGHDCPFKTGARRTPFLKDPSPHLGNLSVMFVLEAVMHSLSLFVTLKPGFYTGGGPASNPSRHRIAALWREGMKPKGRVWAARGARGR
jgi:hypothetical protein